MKRKIDTDYLKGPVLTIILFLMFCTVPMVCLVKVIQFDQECSGYLKQAADANTPEIALRRIDKALEYIERKGLTEGYTSVLYKTENENIGFWYQNVKACRNELEKCLNSSQMEKTNVLMNVRESLTDKGYPTVPSGISLYPNNALWYTWIWLEIIIILIALGRLLHAFED